MIEKARRLAELGAERVLLHDSAGALDPGTCDSVVERLREAAGVPAGLYCQGTGGNALAMAIEAARARAPSRSRRRPTRSPARCTGCRPRCCARR